MNHLLLAEGAADLGYGPIAVLIGIVVLAGLGVIFATHFIPKGKRSGEEKDGTYEAGMPVIGDARRRFNVKFYLVAMMFLIFDVELVFMYPWAAAFLDAKESAQGAETAAMLFWVMIVFFFILTIGFLYEWGKGVLRYD